MFKPPPKTSMKPRIASEKEVEFGEENGPNIGSGLITDCSLSILWLLGQNNILVATHMLPPNYQGIQDSRAIIKCMYSCFLPCRPRVCAYSELVLFLKTFWEP